MQNVQLLGQNVQLWTTLACTGWRRAVTPDRAQNLSAVTYYNIPVFYNRNFRDSIFLSCYGSRLVVEKIVENSSKIQAFY